MVVDLRGRPAPGDGQRSCEGQPECDSARVCVVGRGVRVVHRQRDDDGEQAGKGQELPDVRTVLPAVGRTERGDQQRGGCENEHDRSRVPDPERDVPRAGPQRHEHDEVQAEHAGHDAHPPVDRPPLGGVAPRQRTQRAPAKRVAIRHRCPGRLWYAVRQLPSVADCGRRSGLQRPRRRLAGRCPGAGLECITERGTPEAVSALVYRSGDLPDPLGRRRPARHPQDRSVDVAARGRAADSPAGGCRSAGAPASSRWRTIMAYNSQCADAGFRCSRLLRFSNPDQTYGGHQR